MGYHAIAISGAGVPGVSLWPGSSWEVGMGGAIEDGPGRNISPQESAREMLVRWETQNLDIAAIVRDALRAGRVPLAVVQLHRMRQRGLEDDSPENQAEIDDVFKEVQQVGRAIVYKLLIKGKMAVALAALRRLGEDIEVSLRELAFGSIRRQLRQQAAKELRRHSHLTSRELEVLEVITLLEKAYPSSSFSSVYGLRQRLAMDHLLVDNEQGFNHTIKLRIICNDGLPRGFDIECGDVDGAVLGSWSKLSDKHFVDEVPANQENAAVSYWAAAAVWLSAWNKHTIHRMLLEQRFLIEERSWEARMEYSIAHQQWEDVSSLLDEIPPSILQEQDLHVRLDCKNSYDPFVLRATLSHISSENFKASPRNGSSGLQVDAVDAIIPKVKVLAFKLGSVCTPWIREKIEEKLATIHIFLRTYWSSTTELMALSARAGLVFERHLSRVHDIKPREGEASHSRGGKGRDFGKDTIRAVHDLVVQHCIRNHAPHLLQLYLDHHGLGLDRFSASHILAVMGDCQWARWLLLSRLKGREYDASFANARTILAPKATLGGNLQLPDMENFIPTIDDLAEAGGEIVALSTMMYAPVPVQKCLCTGSITRHVGPSCQCTLENLQPGLQRFPTLWRSLVASCFGHERWGNSSTYAIRDLASRTELAGYLQWRDSLFSSASGDTSLLSMLPQRVPKGVRRLLQIYIQGPIGGGQATDAILWEAAISKSIEEELYAHSSEDVEFGVERHLRRGRALAAFNCLLGLRGQQVLTRGTGLHMKSLHGQVYSSSEVQALLSPLTPEEEKMLVSVMPLAVTNFENLVVVSACASFLELCGLSASMLRIDVAVLRRIADFYKAAETNALSGAGMPSNLDSTAFGHGESIAILLAQSLADEYIKEGTDLFSAKTKLHGSQRSTAIGTNKVFLAILQKLEKASLKEDSTRKGESTAGSWLLTGAGEGARLRAMQRTMSEQWSLVTSFCRVHQLPLSTTYLSVLAKDNDWVGFLAEAQIEGCPLAQLIKVASEEFSDPRIKSHLLTVLRSLPAASQQLPVIDSSSQYKLSINQTVSVPAELFALLAEFEHRKHPGKALLSKAKDLRWPLLAIIASCFPDVTSFSCLTVWLEITAARHTSSIRVNDAAAHVAISVGAAVEATNALPPSSRVISFRYNRKSAKRHRRMSLERTDGQSHGHNLAAADGQVASNSTLVDAESPPLTVPSKQSDQEQRGKQLIEGQINLAAASDEQQLLVRMLAVLCEQQRFLPLLRAFELFTPASPLLPFIRFLQAFSQMRLSEASAHLTSFSVLVKDEIHHMQITNLRSARSMIIWITAAAVTAADAVLATCPSAYERRCLLQLLATANFGDGGSAAIRYGRLHWKVKLAEPALRQGSEAVVQGTAVEDEALLTALEERGLWEEARSWALQLDLSGQQSASAVHHVTAAQAEALVTEWKELLWDVPEERAALWGHCQALFTRHAFPAHQAGIFFLRHAEEIEHEIAPAELHAILLLALRWLSGSMTNSSLAYPLHLLRELETRVWLLAVKSELNMRDENSKVPATSIQSTLVQGFSPDSTAAAPSISLNPVDQTAIAISGVDSHLQKAQNRQVDVPPDESKESGRGASLTTGMGSRHEVKLKRRLKGHGQYKRIHLEIAGRDSEESPQKVVESGTTLADHERITAREEGGPKQQQSVTNWEERVGKGEVEGAILALLEVGQVSAAKQLQEKLSPTHVPLELLLVETAQNVAMLSNPLSKGLVTSSMLPGPVVDHLNSLGLVKDISSVSPLEILGTITGVCGKDCGRGFCERIMTVSQVANFLELPFSEAFQKQPSELLQLLALKGQDALAEAQLLVSTHVMNAASIARILAESFLKGLFAAHRGGYMNSSQREEGPAPLLWRPSDFVQWAQLCPSEPELGHALMRLVISGHDMPHACEVELIILAHHFYESSACLDGMDVLVALAATRVESYVAEGDFSALARLVTGVSNFQALRFVLDLLIENGQLELLLKKRAGVDATKESSASIRGFRMAVLSALKHFNPHDLDAFAMVFSHFNMAHEMAALLESRARKGLLQHWVARHDFDQNEELLEIMRFFVEASEVYGGIDCGNRTRWCCAQASLISLQLRMPESTWLNLTDTNARRLLVEQRRFQEALIVAEAYGLNQSAEWVPVLWYQMSSAGWIEQFLSEFVISLPLPGNMLMELARFYRAEVTARGDQVNFSKWLTPGGMPSELPRYLGKSFRSILKHVRDIRLRIQLATVATGFPDVVDACMRTLDKVPDTAGPLILKKGHGGTYVPLM
ncbi:hypothetical protein O6H91_18G050100 [Diphasiastrum complanatum]|nr:hypothetical protein O6H91_18G050100 [Diphasiastrum complanatum]